MLPSYHDDIMIMVRGSWHKNNSLNNNLKAAFKIVKQNKNVNVNLSFDICESSL